MERLSFIDRRITALMVATLGTLSLAACGQTDPPTAEQVNENIEYFELDGVSDAQGEPVKCVMYGSESEATNNSKSWFAFACDFSGTAEFPDEQ